MTTIDCPHEDFIRVFGQTRAICTGCGGRYCICDQGDPTCCCALEDMIDRRMKKENPNV